MKKYFLIAVGIIALVFLGAGGKYSANSDHGPISILNKTFSNSQVDTIYYSRPGGLATLAFAAHFKDSVSVDSVKLAYIVGGEITSTAQVSLSSFAAFANTTAGAAGSVANPSASVSNTITFTPLTDMLRFIVFYHSSANGVTNAKVDYYFEQQFYE